MNRNAYSFCFLVLTLAGLTGCSSDRAAKESKRAGTGLDKIQGKALVMAARTSADAALNAGGHSLYISDGARRYRLFVRTSVQLDNGKEYVAEGVHAQKVIDEIGDPDQGKNGYPLPSSCERVIKMAWSGLGFYEADERAAVLRRLVSRFPARPIFLVARISPVPPQESGAAGAEPKTSAAAEEKEIPEVSVPAEKQSAFLIQGPTVHPAPLWQPAGGTVRCKVLIDKDGKVMELETGVQLCESVPWSQFRYQPPVQRGRPVAVKTEVEVRFEPRK